MMDLEYFLEMVDAKHRHGSNLRAYHTLWKNSPTSQNFFYWLDQGEGKDVDLPQRPRERLEKEQVRYLSPEERYNYLVKIDSTGRFRWANNDELVDTDDNRYRDSLHGVVPVEDDTPGFKGNSILESTPSEPESTSSPSSPSPGHTEHTVEENHEKQIHSTQGDHELRESVKEPARAKPAAIYDRFARSLSFEKGMWIFVRPETSYAPHKHLSDSLLGRRCVFSYLRWHQRARYFSTFLVSARRSYLCSRNAQNSQRSITQSGPSKVSPLCELLFDIAES